MTGCRPCHRFATSSLERSQPKSFAYQDSRRSLIANCRSTFDAAAHFYRGDTMSFALPAAVPADSLVCPGPNLILTRFNCAGFFSECFISSTTDTSKDDKTPVALCLCHKNSPRSTMGQIPSFYLGNLLRIERPYCTVGTLNTLCLTTKSVEVSSNAHTGEEQPLAAAQSFSLLTLRSWLVARLHWPSSWHVQRKAN